MLLHITLRQNIQEPLTAPTLTGYRLCTIYPRRKSLPQGNLLATAKIRSSDPSIKSGNNSHFRHHSRASRPSPLPRRNAGGRTFWRGSAAVIG